MKFKAEYDSTSSNNADCIQDQNDSFDDYVPKPMKKRQQPKRSFNSNDDSDFSVEPRKNINQRKGKVAAKPEQQPKKKPIVNSDCETDDYESALEKKILKRLAEAQSNDDSDCNENIIKRNYKSKNANANHRTNFIKNKSSAKKSNKNNYDSDYNVRSKSSVGKKQQLKPTTTKKPINQFKNAQPSNYNQNNKGRQYPTKNTIEKEIHTNDGNNDSKQPGNKY